MLFHAFFIILVTAYAVTFGESQPQLPEGVHTLALACIDYAYKQEFKQAQATARRMIKEYPNNPAGYFFSAAVIDAHMELLQSDDEEVEFYRMCDLTINKCEQILEKSPQDIWGKFFLGGANGSRGGYESRYDRWITAFRYGWQGVSALRELVLVIPGLNDALMGIATYDYWRSAMTKMLWWMPGVEDKREDAIKTLYSVMESGMYIKEAAAKQLIPILINEKRYKEALVLADKMLARYPDFLLFRWGRAEALVGERQLDEAEREWKIIGQRLNAFEKQNHYRTTMVRYNLAKTYLLKQRFDLCLAECTKVSKLTFDDVTRKRLEKPLAELEDMKRQVETGGRRAKHVDNDQSNKSLSENQ